MKIPAIGQQYRNQHLLPTVLLSLTAGIFLLNLYGIVHGITTVLPHLFYVPIVIAAYYYTRRGILFAGCVSLAYYGMVLLTSPTSVDLIWSALSRGLVFILVAIVIVYLSTRLHQETEERTRLGCIVTSSIDAVVGLTREGIITNWNTGAECLYGYKAAEIIGKPMTILLPPEKQDESDRLMMEIQNGRSIERYETERITVDHRRIQISLSVSPIKNNNGKIIGFSTIAHDISSQKQLDDVIRKAQTEVEEHERVLQQVIDTIPNPVFYKDAAGVYTGCNKAFIDYIGLPKKQIIGKTVYDIAPPELADIYADKDQELFDHPGIQVYETRVKYANGSLHDVIFNKATFNDNQGNAEGLVGVILDITDRKRAEELLRDHADWYDTILKTTQDGYNLVDREGTILEVNDNYCLMTGYTRDELIGKSLFDQDTVENRDDALVHLQHIFVLGSDRFETRHRTKDNRTIEVEISVTSQRYKKQLIVFVRDISERKRTDAAIRESIEKYRRFFMTSMDCVFITSKDGQWIDLNDAAVELFGYQTREELMQVKIADLYENQEDRSRHIETIVAKGYSKEYPVNLRKKDGSILNTLITAVARYDGEGSMIGFQGTIRDISERRKIELAIRESEERYRRITEAVTDYIYTVRVNSGLAVETRHGAGCVGVTGYTSEEFAADPYLWIEMVVKEDRPLVEEQARRVLSGQDVSPIEHRIIRRDGSLHWVRNTIVPRRNEQALVVSYDGLVQDITDRKYAEIALRESEKKYRDFIELLPQTAFELDTSGRVILSNPVTTKMFGYSDVEIRSGLSAFDLLDPRDLERARINFFQIQKGEDMGAVEYTAKRKDGSTFPMIVYSSPRISEQKVVGTRGIAIDISERKKMEEALRLANKKLTMLSSITRHDILNSLTAMLAYLEFSREKVKDNELLSGYIEKELLIAETIQHQIEFTRYYEDIGVNAPEFQDLNEQIRLAASHLQIGDLDLRISIPSVFIYADRLIEKVFFNLMENSLRHGGPITHIGFMFFETDKGGLLIYEDDGIGIPDHDRDQLFTRGFGKHTGLGLFLSREILAITGITIQEKGESHKGVRFELCIPKEGYRLTT